MWSRLPFRVEASVLIGYERQKVNARVHTALRRSVASSEGFIVQEDMVVGEKRHEMFRRTKDISIQSLWTGPGCSASTSTFLSYLIGSNLSQGVFYLFEENYGKSGLVNIPTNAANQSTSPRIFLNLVGLSQCT